jgi:hypothetical protein
MTPVESADQRSAEEIQAGTRRLLVAFAVFTLLAVVQLLLLADVADRYWAWTIRTELTAAFLGAAYAAGFVLSVFSLRQDDWSRIRVPILTVTAFTWLTSAATVIHLHRLHMVTGGPYARAVAWVWVTVYVVIPLASVLVVVRQERRRSPPGAAVRPMPRWLTVLLAVEGAVLGTAGLVLFASGATVHHHEPRIAAGFWPWELMPLSAQVIGAWFIALALAAALAIHQHDLHRLLVSCVTYTAFGVFQFVAVIWYAPHLRRDDVWLWGYLALLAAIVLTGAYGWWAAGESPRDHSSGPGVTAETRRPATTGTRGRPQPEG